MSSGDATGGGMRAGRVARRGPRMELALRGALDPGIRYLPDQP